MTSNSTRFKRNYSIRTAADYSIAACFASHADQYVKIGNNSGLDLVFDTTETRDFPPEDVAVGLPLRAEDALIDVYMLAGEFLWIAGGSATVQVIGIGRLRTSDETNPVFVPTASVVDLNFDLDANVIPTTSVIDLNFDFPDMGSAFGSGFGQGFS